MKCPSIPIADDRITSVLLRPPDRIRFRTLVVTALAAGAGSGGSGPRRCASALEAAGQAAAPRRRDSLPPQPLPMAPNLTVCPFPVVDHVPRARLEPDGRGAPKACP